MLLRVLLHLLESCGLQALDHGCARLHGHVQALLNGRRGDGDQARGDFEGGKDSDEGGRHSGACNERERRTTNQDG